MRFFSELKRRNVIRETLAYVVVSWVILQVGSIIFPTFDAPGWVMKAIAFLLIIGLPLWVLFSWAYQITPQGVRKTPKPDEEQLYSSKAVKRLDIIIFLMLVVAIGISILDRPLLTYFSDAPQISNIPAKSSTDKSIAVLPFTNLSPESDQEYFALGLSEELINRFSQLPDLRVIGRTSSFSYKGSQKDSREIGEELNVNYIIDGSVRKSGDLLRITVQLIDTEDGSHIWSDTYNRETEDIFKVQNEISKQVTGALKITVLDQGSKYMNEDIHPDAYDHFLRGRFLYETFSVENSTLKALDEFEQAIKIDSMFSLAWTYKSMCHWRQSGNNPDEFQKAKGAAIKAFEQNPNSGIAAVNLAEIMDTEYNFYEALKLIDLAVMLEPNNPYVLRNAGRFYTIIGKHKESIRFCQDALRYDPIQRTALLYMIRALYYSNQPGKAFNAFLKFQEWYPYLDPLSRVEHIKILSEHASEPDLIKSIREKSNSKGKLYLDFLLACQSGDVSQAAKILDNLKKIVRDDFYFLAQCYADMDQPEKALDMLELAYDKKQRHLMFIKVNPVFEPIRQETRFQALIQKMNYPD